MQPKKLGWFAGAIALVLLMTKVGAQTTTVAALTSAPSTPSDPPTTPSAPPSTPSDPPTTPSVPPSTPSDPPTTPSDPPSTPSVPPTTPSTPPMTTQEPTTTRPPTPPPPMKLTCDIKYTGESFDDATNGSTLEGKRLRTILCELIIKDYGNVIVIKCTIIEVRLVNSVVVTYELVINSTTREEARQVVNEIEKEIKTGKIGNYTVDPEHPLGAKLTLQENIDGVTPSPAPPPPDDSKTLIILLGVGLGLLVLVLVLLVVLFIKLRNKGGG